MSYNRQEQHQNLKMNIPTTFLTEEPNFVFTDKLDREFLHKNYSQNLELAKGIFALFVQNIDQDLHLLKTAAETKDYDQIAAISHKIKNNFIYIGASEISCFLKRIEVEAKEQNDKLFPLFEKFQTTVDQMIPTIKEEHNRLVTFLST